MRSALFAIRDLGRELLFIGGFVGSLWLASYIYELGFLARFRVPVGFAEIGFPRGFAAVLLLGPVAAAAAAVVLVAARPRLRDLRGIFLPAAVLCTLALVAGAALLDPSILPPRVLAGVFGLEVHPLLLGLLVSLAVYAARLGGHCLGYLRHGDAPSVAQSMTVVVLLMLGAGGLGWWGAGKKADSRASFLYLVGQEEDFVLVRLYDDKAVFVRYDRAAGRFLPEHLVRSVGDAPETLVRFRPRR